MIDHIGISVSDLARAKVFYAAALAPLGYALFMEAPGQMTDGGLPAVGFSIAGKPAFWIGGDRALCPGAHIAFAATNRQSVAAFYEAALLAGGRDNGAPGVRPKYHLNYYAAFVLDPDGNNIEAVCHNPV
jgi:catechol 2,3-dioxygenase-like lactoylglutathione lyase family enzyme